MPFTTGTAATPSVLLKAINDHLVANGWTKLRGDTDLNCASPKAARYWRILVWESQNTTIDFRGLQLFNMRTTPGGANVATNGANFSCSSVATGTASLMAAGGLLRSADIDDQLWSVTYDFGSPTTIREFYVRGDSTQNNSPRDFAFQWSNDNQTWTTMQTNLAVTWTASEYKTFTVADGYVNPRHASGTAPRRSGGSDRFDENVANWYLDEGRDTSDDYFIWQGPGYDAARRVYVHMRGHVNTPGSSHVLQLDFSTEYDAGVSKWGFQFGSSDFARAHLMSSSSVAYWIYSNSKRIILVTRSGAQDYTSTYIGFMSSFGLPDDYPFPLLISSTEPTITSYVSGDTNARLSSCADPGLNCAVARLWDGTLIAPGNRPDTNASNLYLQRPTNSWVFPYHFGTNGRPVWPYGYNSDFVDYVGGHLFDYMLPTQQGHLPLFPCTVQHDPYGNIGVMDGVFALPSGSSLTPTQVITIAGQDYRVFPNRTRRDGVNWFCIRED